jgi:hypothetical protein
MLKHYRSSFVFTAVAMVLGYMLGGIPGAGIVLILGILETSLSFDNAVVNASVLKNWDHKWRQRFLVWGMPIAVFGMRLLFPLAIVGIAAHINPWAAMTLALEDPKQYEVILTSVHAEIAAFGGAFLMMVFLAFFFDQEKELHWVDVIEAPLARLGRLDMAAALITLIAVGLTSHFVPKAESAAFLLAGIAGLATYIMVDGLGAFIGGDEGGDEVTKNIVKQGVAGFLYLEVLDASFSFDGVIAAFALSNNIFVIMIGLAVGAMFVRSMTLHLVEAGTLSEFRYLEHGAFWAIGALAVLMFTGAVMHVSEVITGLIGASAIGLALWSSIRANRAEQSATSYPAALNAGEPS